jgi:hypothetical protein
MHIREKTRCGTGGATEDLTTANACLILFRILQQWSAFDVSQCRIVSASDGGPLGVSGRRPCVHYPKVNDDAS